MKFETLIKRYSGLGYQPKGLEPALELEAIILWIYDKYDIFIYVMFHDVFWIKAYNMAVKKNDVNTRNINSFIAHKIWQCSTEYSNTTYGDNYFNNPFDAKFDTVKNLWKAINFQYGKNYNNIK